MDEPFVPADDLPAAARRVFTNRTLNLRSIKAIGFDMDYTLIHYVVEAWERSAFRHLKARLDARGWPVEGIEFDAKMVALGLILDLDHGNVVKANRFGYVKRAAHGTALLAYDRQRELYSRDQVDLADPRWVFLNTQFSLSEACMFSHMVDRLDEGRIPGGPHNYADVYEVIRASLDEAHMAGQLKAEIVADPDRFVEKDPQLPLALLDLKHAGKKLLLITNSEWSYTRPMMTWAFDPHLPDGMTWQELFDIVIVSARKPSFFEHPNPAFEVVDEEKGHLLPVPAPHTDGIFLGGHAAAVEEELGLSGDEILYVGDHIFSDVRVSQSLLRWRTALVIRSLEDELAALSAFEGRQATITRLMADKTRLEHRYSSLRLARQRRQQGYGPQPTQTVPELAAAMDAIKAELKALDDEIQPLAVESGGLANERWGLLLRTGTDKSHLARQIERYADVYTSRVSNLLAMTPFAYLRSPRGSLPHDFGPGGGAD